MAIKVGVTDSAAGAGVQEFLGLETSLGASILTQAFDQLPGGEEFSMSAFGPSITPQLISATATYWDIAAMQVPTGKFLLVDKAVVTNLAADDTRMRVAKRYRFAGNCAQASPAAGGAPTVAAVAMVATGLGTGSYSYKISQVNALGQESALSTVSATVTPTAGQGINLTVPALGTGAVAYRIYRSLSGAGGTGPWYWVDDAIAGVYTDTMPDSDVTGVMRGSVQHPGTTWGNVFTGEVAPTACEMVFENTGVALASAPTQISYISSKGVRQVAAFAPAVTANLRQRIPPSNEGRAFATPGPATVMLQRDEISDYGAVAVSGFDKSYATIGGQWLVYGYSVRGQTEIPLTPVIGSVAEKFNPPLLFVSGETIVGQIGNLGAALAGVRAVEIFGRMFDNPP